jgi:hypothetical protein
MTQPNNVLEGKASNKSSPAHHWSDTFLEIRHQLHTLIYEL